MSDTEPPVPAGDAEDAAGGAEPAPGGEPAEERGGSPDSPRQAAEPGTTTQTTARRRHLPRRISAWVLVVLASILIPVSVISVWAIRTVTDTDQYVATMAPLARNPVIVDHLSAQGDRRALLDPHRAEQGHGRPAGQGEASRDAHHERGAHLRRGPGGQGLLEPEVRPAVGHAEPAQPRRGDQHPHRQADTAAEEARQGRARSRSICHPSSTS